MMPHITPAAGEDLPASPRRTAFPGRRKNHFDGLERPSYGKYSPACRLTISPKFRFAYHGYFPTNTPRISKPRLWRIRCRCIGRDVQRTSSGRRQSTRCAKRASCRDGRSSHLPLLDRRHFAYRHLQSSTAANRRSWQVHYGLAVAE